MAIYADKRDGRLTGKFRVELQRGAERYRRRHTSMAEAEEDEKRVLAAWDAGEGLQVPEAPTAADRGITLREGIQRAKGVLWSQDTIGDYNYGHLEFFASVVGDDKPLAEVVTEDVRQMIRKLDAKGRSNGTINRYLSHLRTFLKWHMAERSIPDVVSNIVWDNRREAKHRMRWLSYAEEETMVSLVPEKTGKLIRVAIETGCRREELLSLKANQIEDGMLHLWKTKNNDPRSIPLSRETELTLRELVEEGMPSQRSLRRHWDKARAEMGLADDPEFVFHACRHTCATRMVDADIDIVVIKEWLGHKKIETTQRYAKVRPKKLLSVLARVGELRALETGKSQISAVPHVPPQSPHGGGKVPNTLAA